MSLCKASETDDIGRVIVGYVGRENLGYEVFMLRVDLNLNDEVAYDSYVYRIGTHTV